MRIHVVNLAFYFETEQQLPVPRNAQFREVVCVNSSREAVNYDPSTHQLTKAYEIPYIQMVFLLPHDDVSPLEMRRFTIKSCCSTTDENLIYLGAFPADGAIYIVTERILHEESMGV
jgi:hypothetical protein